MVCRLTIGNHHIALSTGKGDTMIIAIDGMNKDKFGAILADMHRLRARVFHDRLGWEVEVRDGMEIDSFDALDPTHIVSLDEEGRVVGCMRLLQTTGPHMLADVFCAILDGEPPLRSAQLWEATRFCVDTEQLDRGRSRNSISYVTSEVMVGAFEYARRAGVLDAIAVIDPVMNRVLIRSGNAPVGYVGTPKQMGKVKAMAALMDCSQERIAAIRRHSGIEHDVFLSDDEALALHRRSEAGAGNAGRGELFGYFVEQLHSAESVEERQAVIRLIEAVPMAESDRQALRAMLSGPSLVAGG